MDESYMLEGAPETHEIDSSNGLQAVNGLSVNNGLIANNGFMSNNGLASNNGLSTNNGLASNNGLMTNNGGRKTVEYVSKCALGANDYYDKQDNTGTWHRFRGGLGFGTGWKSGSCDQTCQEFVSACTIAHLNSTGNSVPIWVNADPGKAPQVGFGMAYESSKDQNFQEGVYFGNVLAMNPPKAYYAKGNGFKGNIPGRLGASSTNPYKPFEGRRSDDGQFYSGLGAALCSQDPAPDGYHFDFSSCQKADYQGGPITEHWDNVVTAYVNSNYSGAVSQNFSAKTITFDGVANDTQVTKKPWEVATIEGFDFSNSVHNLTTGILTVKNRRGSSTNRQICTANTRDLVISKNGGEPFSITSLRLEDEYSSWNQTVTIRVYRKGVTSGVMTTYSPVVPGGGSVTQTFSGMDGVIRVELRAPANMNVCVDDVAVKT